MFRDRIRILIVDDHALDRGVLRDRFVQEPGLEVVGEAATPSEALDCALQRKPDVVLMHMDVPRLNCFDAAQKMMFVRPDVRILFLVRGLCDQHIQRALEVGAAGVLTKCEPYTTVVAALREVAAGGRYFSAPVQARIVDDTSGERPLTRSCTLTSREVEVLQCMARGMAKKDIAYELKISRKTVDSHSVNMMSKLDLHNRVYVALYALREGFATL